MYEPTWKTYEKGMKSPDPETQRKATDAFLSEREKETATSRKSAEWENARKDEVAKSKPEWVKKQRAIENDPGKQFIEHIKDGGAHDARLKPARGYVLIRVEEQDTTASGLYISQDATDDNNTAEVLEIGDDLILDKYIVPTPVKVGCRIIFKKYAGMNLTLMGEGLRLIQFSDILGELV